jgi:hypothetical protein
MPIAKAHGLHAAGQPAHEAEAHVGLATGALEISAGNLLENPVRVQGT